MKQDRRSKADMSSRCRSRRGVHAANIHDFDMMMPFFSYNMLICIKINVEIGAIIYVPYGRYSHQHQQRHKDTACFSLAL